MSNHFVVSHHRLQTHLMTGRGLCSWSMDLKFSGIGRPPVLRFATKVIPNRLVAFRGSLTTFRSRTHSCAAWVYHGTRFRHEFSAHFSPSIPGMSFWASGMFSHDSNGNYSDMATEGERSRKEQRGCRLDFSESSGWKSARSISTVSMRFVSVDSSGLASHAALLVAVCDIETTTRFLSTDFNHRTQSLGLQTASCARRSAVIQFGPRRALWG